MAVSLLARLAAAAPAPVFAVAGIDGLRAVERLALDPRVELVASPRHAAILLVAGEIRPEDRADLYRLHDQMPHPRATVWWASEPLFAGIPVGPHGFPAGDLADLHRALAARAMDSDPDILPDEPPNPWRGKGDYGQGGEGMMGGTPYGRPMAMTADDLRDGLALDAYSATFGPFLPAFPPGLVLDLTLQGDVIQSAEVLRPPYLQHELRGPAAYLRRAARLVRLLGLPAVAERLRRRPEGCGALARTGVFAAIPAGLGRLGGYDVRDRLRAWCEERTPPPLPEEARLAPLLPGLEWHAAVLVINSFTDAELRSLCGAREVAA
ncbi:hypothetical protein [Caenispirillum bisanense]|uniref:DUF4123 domain-containing protein n=1 Tax=Caenispirillum bisanense TaxID=414052 RepID=A0A286GWR1_9PROT|nr:hypothetical protein [Caenispirillum bisanense]SOD99616.1 hypothetical protein SAMN05421508_10991 [Caenispirillum bisanense]